MLFRLSTDSQKLAAKKAYGSVAEKVELEMLKEKPGGRMLDGPLPTEAEQFQFGEMSSAV